MYIAAKLGAKAMALIKYAVVRPTSKLKKLMLANPALTSCKQRTTPSRRNSATLTMYRQSRDEAPGMQTASAS
jgi:hypothetical protein